LFSLISSEIPASNSPLCQAELSPKETKASNIPYARYEGIVLKDVASPYTCGDRSGRWIKIKPDYVKGATDLDVLIMGGFYGQGCHGGQVTFWEARTFGQLNF
jgi:ATP-dependent DNA ligase